MDPYDPAVDLMRKRLREKALANIAAEAQSQDALIDGLSPAVGGYMAKKYAPELVQPVQHGPEFNPEGEGMPGYAAAQERTKDAADLASAGASAREARRVAGLGKAGMMLAQAFGARNADTSTFDQMAQSAEQRSATVRKYMQDKLAKRQDQDFDMKRLGVQQQGAKDLAAQNSAADLERTKYMQNEEWRRLMAQLGAEKDKAKVAGDAKRAEQLQKLENDLAQDYLGNQDTKAMQSSQANFKQVMSAPGNGSGDLSLIYGMAKLWDPGGRVTDKDAENAAQTGGLPGQLQSYFNKFSAKGSLGDGERAQLKKEAERIMSERAGAHKPLQESFRGRASAYGADPARVVPDLGFGGQQAATGPHGPTVKQNGTTYTWNPQTGRYE